MNVTMPTPVAGDSRLGDGFSVPEVAVERTPARRMLQRRDRATANIRPGNLGARGALANSGWEFTALGVLALCGFASLVLAFW